jgi:hypothetical protein
MRALQILVLLTTVTTAMATPRDVDATSEASDVNDRARAVDDGEAAPGAVRDEGPAVRDVIAAAYRAAGLGTHDVRGLARRARLAGLVPLLTVRTARGSSWHDLEQDVGRSTTLEVRATWRLDRLMFEPRELQVASLEAARRRERRRLAKQVIRAYYAWQRGTRADEAAAELDELTDGWFAKAVENRGATSGARTVGGVPARMP